MPADCNPDCCRFEAVSGRRVEAVFDGGVVTSDAGGLLPGLTWKALALTRRFAACFADKRNPDLGEHSVETLLRQRVMGLAMGGACPWAGGAGPGGRPERSRPAAPRSGAGAVGGQARGEPQRLRGGGRQVDAEPAGALRAASHALSQDRPRRGGDRAVVRRPVPGEPGGGSKRDRPRLRRHCSATIWMRSARQSG